MNSQTEALIDSARRALEAGDMASGREHLRRAAVRAGLSADQWLQLGELSRRAGDPAGAESALNRAAALVPADPGPRVALAALLRAVGRPGEALDHLEAACALTPLDARAAHLMGVMHLDQGLVAGAKEWLERARGAGGDSADLEADLGQAAQAGGDLAEARACYSRALARDPRNERALRGMARLARIAGRPEEGVAILQPMAAQLPGGLLAELAGLLAAAGRPGEAIALLDGPAADMGAGEDRMEVDFRLAKLHDARGDREAAMFHLMRANRQKAARFDPDRYAGLVDRLLAAFGPERMDALARAGHGDGRPVFIVGMPRSGTSLVEQILASHREIHGAGELADLGLLALSTARGGLEYPESIGGLGPADVERLASSYRARLDAIAPAATRVTDKMWQNFEFLGFGAMLFPEARVIHCARNPMDTGLSCFFQHFYGAGVPFSYDLEHIGAYYRQYRRVMAHWRAVLPLPILDVDYEALVADPEEQARRMLDFCGLAWDPACLRFFETERVVGTASYEQVRRPVYRSSVGRHRDYRRWLEPLARALGDDADRGA